MMHFRYAYRAGTGVPRFTRDPLQLHKHEKPLDFEGPVRQNLGLSEFAPIPLHICSNITVRPDIAFPIPACSAPWPTAHPQRRTASGARHGRPPEMSKKTLEMGPLRAVSDTTVRSHTDGLRNS